MAEIDDFNREIELTRKNEKLMRFLDKRARQNAATSHDELRARLELE